MAISDTITSIENHLTANYEGLENIGADLTNIDKNIENIRPVLDTIYSNLPKVTGEGTEVTLSPTLKGKLGIVEKGNSTQEGTPTPSSPVSIKSVTGNNNVVVNSANLLNQSSLEWGNISTTTGENGGGNGAFIRTKTFIKVSGGSKYSGNYTKSTGPKQFTLYKYDSNKNYLGYDIYDSVNNFTKTLENNVNYIKLRLLSVGNTETEILNNISDVIFNNGDVIPYVPYQNQTLPLNLGNIELNGIGTYDDKMFKAVNGNTVYDSLTSEQKALLTYGKWYKHTDLKEITMTGTGTWNYISTRTNTALFYSSINDLYNVGNVSALDLKCDRFINQAVYGNDVQGIQHSQTSVYISIDKTLLSTIDVAGFKSWLSSNNTTLLYPLATSTNIEITETELISQLEDIDKLMGYNGTTIITSTFEEGNAQMILSVSGLKGE